MFWRSPNQVPYIKEIRKLNFKIFLLDKNKVLWKRFFKRIFTYGYDQFDKIKDFAKNNLLDSYKVKHVFSAAAQFSQLGVSFISELLYLDFINKNDILNCLDKKKFYKIFNNLSAPFPKTEFISNFEELKNFFLDINLSSNWYLKSDFVKPNYIYKINKDNFYNINIFWEK